MENYRVLGPVPSNISKIPHPVALKFDYGLVHHPIHGCAKLVGTSPYFEQYEDYVGILEDMDFPSNALVELQSSVLQDLESIGLPCNADNSQLLRVMGKCYTMDTFDLCLVFYRGIPVNSTRPYLLLNMVYILYEDIMDSCACSEDGPITLETVNSLIKSVLHGDITHLDQMVQSYDMDIRIFVALVILLRKSCLASKTPDSWPFLERDVLRFMQASLKEIKRSTPWTLEEYLIARPYSVGMYAILEADWMIRGVNVPLDARHDYDFDQFKNLLSLCTGLQNDIIGLQKEINRGEPHNVVVIMAESGMTLQEAITGSLTLLANTWYEAKSAARNLQRTFPNDKIIENLIRASGRAVDFCIPLLHSISNRYGYNKDAEDSRTIEWVTIEFNDEYLTKEWEFRTHANNNNDIEIIPQKERENPIQFQVLKNPTISCELKHMAFIPDGNRRWASEKGLPPWDGHEVGRHALCRLVRESWALGIHTVTIWGLSPDNINRRPQIELDHLWIILIQAVKDFRGLADEFGGRFCHIGSKERLPPRVLNVISKNEAETVERTQKCLILAIDYDGVQDILRSVSKCREEGGVISAADITRNTWTGDLIHSDPDLIVRTGGKDSQTKRISGFMTWQSVYSEFFFEDKYFPDIEESDVRKWVNAFKSTERRFGK